MTEALRNRTAATLRMGAIGLMLWGGSLAAPSAAQDGSLFAPRMVINGQTVTNFEVEQRMLFLRALRAPGDPEKEALKALMRDRLGAQAAKDAGITLTAEQVTEGMTEFAARANLSVEDFTAALADEGVAPETFRDFVANGILWRELVRARFGPQVRISEAQIDRALAENAKTQQVRVLLSELILPVQGDDVTPVLDQARTIKAEVSGRLRRRRARILGRAFGGAGWAAGLAGDFQPAAPDRERGADAVARRGVRSDRGAGGGGPVPVERHQRRRSPPACAGRSGICAIRAAARPRSGHDPRAGR